MSALGGIATGVFSNNDALAREVIAAGDCAWDRAWHMPLWHEYQGSFPWVHLDIAGTAAKSGADKGATGRPVPLLAHFLAGRMERTGGQ